MSFSKNQVVRAEISSYSADGFGVARLDGFVIFVPLSARGDLLDIKLVKVLKNYAFGIIERIITPSKFRIEPCCPAFSKCGGCDFLHISYEEELALKSELVRDAMARIGGFSGAFPEVVPSPALLRSRNKALFPIEKGENGAVFGFYRRHSHAVVPISDCPINDERASALARAVTDWADENQIEIYSELNNSGIIRRVFTRCSENEVLLTLVCAKMPDHTDALTEKCRAVCPGLCGIVLNINDRRTNLALGDKCITLWGKSTLGDTLCGKKYELSPLSFYQVNHAQAEQLYEYAVSLCALDKSRDALDLYCGVGTITLALAEKCRRAVGAEIVERAIEDARKNAAENKAENADFICADAGFAAEKLGKEGFSPYAIVCDPPRKGMDAHALDAVLSFKAERIVYVACEPSSLARDGKYLCERGYTLSEYKCFDMFPRTANVETCAVFIRG